MSGFDINILKEKTEKSLNVLREELGTVRAGRANAALVDKVTVDYYGSPTPLKALSNISVPDPRTSHDLTVRSEEHPGNRTCDQCS